MSPSSTEQALLSAHAATLCALRIHLWAGLPATLTAVILNIAMSIADLHAAAPYFSVARAISLGISLGAWAHLLEHLRSSRKDHGLLIQPTLGAEPKTSSTSEQEES